MRTFPRILVTTALCALVLSTLTLTTWAADAGDPVKSSHPPYKVGREIDDADTQSARAPDDGADPVKSSHAPYKQGRQADDGAEPVKSSHEPYKPGREADGGQDADSTNN